MATENVIFALGNPLLDISATVDEGMLEKYGLKANDAILAEDKHIPMYEELSKHETVSYTAGGATQNSIRVAQHYMDNARATTFVGCVGSDEYATKLSEAAAHDGVRVEYLVDEATPTGTCGCLITGKNRSLVANLSAANNYKADHLQSEAIWSLVTQAQIFYSAGFHLTVSPEAMLNMARHAADTNKIYCFNLSAPFLVQFFKDQMAQVMPYADYVFGNEDEAADYATHNGIEKTDLKEIALAIAALDKVNTQRSRTVVITCGSEETIVAKDGAVTTYAVDKIEDDKIIDTNGAGDAFVGGFLAALAKGQDIAACVEAGHVAARMIIQCSGIVLPAKFA
ncbi:adenosine kinase [Thecamonas trahens ATCC 50062]|uniref:Adenosine kinase n=1 Tax=Thecamonas trahens ATCC 50062 TaxID=461836 RepID=A0A0L0D362_THETB|nr:adenosine kinase [Thecamonas trahens ATCC 50062]KNC46749.1 adenosine kinase [Thecamonas trahens ATCC 50062]|eukprot:XP_013760029.1 adenosine kinase [Thecamonas trahens ATCC 50062]